MTDSMYFHEVLQDSTETKEKGKTLDEFLPRKYTIKGESPLTEVYSPLRIPKEQTKWNGS
jgi:hypothetical protein